MNRRLFGFCWCAPLENRRVDEGIVAESAARIEPPTEPTSSADRLTHNSYFVPSPCSLHSNSTSTVTINMRTLLLVVACVSVVSCSHQLLELREFLLLLLVTWLCDCKTSVAMTMSIIIVQLSAAVFQRLYQIWCGSVCCIPTEMVLVTRSRADWRWRGVLKSMIIVKRARTVNREWWVCSIDHWNKILSSNSKLIERRFIKSFIEDT